MKIKELRERLKEIEEEHGNLEVEIHNRDYHTFLMPLPADNPRKVIL